MLTHRHRQAGGWRLSVQFEKWSSAVVGRRQLSEKNPELKISRSSSVVVRRRRRRRLRCPLAVGCFDTSQTQTCESAILRGIS